MEHAKTNTDSIILIGALLSFFLPVMSIIGGNGSEQATYAKSHAGKKAQYLSFDVEKDVRIPALDEAPRRKVMSVQATAYNNVPAQTDDTPDIAAWGDRIAPGMKLIAVSRDLLHTYGLKHRDKVRISGLEGEWEVLDKMNKRYTKRIDVYMGKDIKAARQFGLRDVTITWEPDAPMVVALND